MHTLKALVTSYPWLEAPVARLTAYIVQDRMPHALIISGVSGLGKAKLARMLAKTILCDHVIEGEACGVCECCKLYQNETHSDYTEIQVEEGGSLIKIEQIRALIQKLSQAPAHGKNKVAVILDAEKCQDKPANALLKTLEEPLGNAVLILVTEAYAALPITIASRCSKVVVHTPHRELLDNWLKKTCKHNINTGEFIFRLGNGSPFKIQSLIQDDAEHALHKTLVSVFIAQNKPLADVLADWQKKSPRALVDVLHVMLSLCILYRVQPNARMHAEPLLQPVLPRIAMINLDAVFHLYDELITLHEEIQMGIAWQMNRLIYALYYAWCQVFKEQ